MCTRSCVLVAQCKPERRCRLALCNQMCWNTDAVQSVRRKEVVESYGCPARELAHGCSGPSAALCPGPWMLAVPMLPCARGHGCPQSRCSVSAEHGCTCIWPQSDPVQVSAPTPQYRHHHCAHAHPHAQPDPQSRTHLHPRLHSHTHKHTHTYAHAHMRALKPMHRVGAEKFIS